MSVATVLDAALEVPVVTSFTKLGYAARRRLFDWTPLEELSLRGRTIVLTGPTSGLGEAAAHAFATMGADLVLVARDPDKTAALRAELETQGAGAVDSVLADLGDLDQVRRAAGEIVGRHERVDALIHNAGALFNERRTADDGTELTVQVMVAAPFLLTGLLLDQLGRAAPGRVITNSSGGMYTQGLTVAGLEMSVDDYNGSKQYARAKRAQVVLNEMWAERVDPTRVVFHALHPGWADTPGVVDALPGFHKIVGPALRDADEGADTMVWLAAADRAVAETGRFWLDRRVRSTHKLPMTKRSDTPERRAELWAWCEQHTGFHLD